MIAVRSSVCALTIADRMTAAPSTIFTNSANVEDAVLPAHTDATMTKAPSVANRTGGAVGVHSGAKTK